MKFDKTLLTAPTLVGLSLPLIGMPVWNLVAGLLLREMDRFARAVLGSSITVGLALGVIAVVLWWEKKPATQLGWRPQTRRTIIFALSASIVIAVGGTLISLLIIKLFSLPMPVSMAENLSVFPVWFSVWLVLSGSIAEEVLYRGFVIERLGQLSGNIWTGALITLVWFNLLHLPLGLVYTLSIVLPTSILITLLYVWRRDLVATIIVHFVFNAPLIVISLIPFLQGA
ncbi:CPBP family intramembrane glutamic endopeptidase [Chloroflexota bacterium]